MIDQSLTEELKETVAVLRRRIRKLEDAKKSLSSEKRILDEILDNLPSTFYIWDDRPRLVRRNRKHDEITEYSESDYENMLPTDFFGEEERESVEAAVQKVFAEGEVVVEATLVTKSGKKIPHLYSAVRTTIGDKPVLMGFGIDISKQKAVERRLRRALAEVAKLRKRLEADRDYLGEEIKVMHDHEHIVGESEVFKYVLYRVEQIGPTDSTVLVRGETGTGKELIARAIHHCSKRKDRPLVKVDCASLPDSLIESELFGHEKGAFTGAHEKRIGRFELADGATVFLDEVGELPLKLQRKLLRVLQEGEFERLGSSETMRTDVRVIAATNRDLEKDVEDGRFRKDLLYRLDVFPLSIPPLRKRVEDIPPLVNWMIRKNERKFGKRIETIPSDIMDDFESYEWPGNVRELQNVIERSLIVTKGSTFQLAFPLGPPPPVAPPPPETSMKTLAEMEKEHIVTALAKTNWNISGKGGAADLLGLNSSTLRGRMRKHGIRRPGH